MEIIIVNAENKIAQAKNKSLDMTRLGNILKKIEAFIVNDELDKANDMLLDIARSEFFNKKEINYLSNATKKILKNYNSHLDCLK